MNNILISIIVPVYNTNCDFLEKCVKSLLEQTYKNIEILIIDDGSNSENLKKYEKICSVSNIKWIKRKNFGVSTTRNYGIENANGNYIMFVDSDDYLEVDACEKMADIIDKQDIDVIISNANKVINENKEFYNSKINESKMLNKMERKKLIDSIFLDGIGGSTFYFADTPWAKLFKKDFLNNYKIHFETELKMGEDGIFNFEAYYNAKSIYFMKDSIYNYRVNEESVCNKYNEFIVEMYFKILKKYNDLFDKYNIKDYRENYDYFAFRQLRKQVIKYFCNNKNSRSYKIRKKQFLEVKNSEIYKNSIENLDLKKLSNSRKILYFLIRYDMFFILNKIYFK